MPELPPAAEARAVRNPEQRRRAEHEAERSEVRAAVVRFLLVGLLTLAVVSAPSALLMQHLARQHTLEGLEDSAEMMAQNMIAPLVDDAFLAGDPRAGRVLDRVAQARVADGSVVRLTVWDRSGLVLYSDASDLVGRLFPNHDWDDALLVDGLTVSSFEDDGVPQSRYEHDGGRFVEVDTPFRSASGHDLIFEAYYPAEIVHAQQRDMLLKLLPVGLGTLLVLQIGQLPPAIRLARRIQGLQVGRRNLLHQAAAASDLERRRIARDLHDDVIQELAGVSYSLEAVEKGVGPADRPVLDRARSVLRSSVRDLRTMLSELYPADLDMVGLPAALDKLADGLRAQGVRVQVDVAKDLSVPPGHATLLYRVARESLTNAAKHAHPAEVAVRLSQASECVVLEIADDGDGFDTAAVDAAAVEGHLGLRLIRDTVGEAGGTVEVGSEPGVGTRVVATVPLV
jgi:signal transduction histidine kinase